MDQPDPERVYLRPAGSPGAPLGGWLADTLGYRPTLWIAIAGFVAVTLFLAASLFRHARHEEA